VKTDVLGFPSSGHAHNIETTLLGFKLSALGPTSWPVTQGMILL